MYWYKFVCEAICVVEHWPLKQFVSHRFIHVFQSVCLKHRTVLYNFYSFGLQITGGILTALFWKCYTNYAINQLRMVTLVFEQIALYICYDVN